MGFKIVASLPLVWLVLLTSRLFGGNTVQELGLPSPVQREWIFANAAMGRAGPTEFQYCLTFSNRTAVTGYAEYGFFLQSGERPAFSQNGLELPSAGSLVVSPWRNVDLCFNSVAYPLESPDFFVGWAEVKSSAEILVAAKMTSRDRQSGETGREVDLFGNTSPVQQARFQLSDSKSGLALVNPFDEALEVRLSIERGNRLDPPEDAVEVAELAVTLPPRTQRSFVVEDELGEQGTVLKMELTGDGVGFGYTALSFYTNLEGVIHLYLPPPYFQNLANDLVVFEKSNGKWDLPVLLEDSLELGEKWIGITGFGYYVREPSGVLSLFLEPGVESLGSDPAHSLAFVNHYEGKQLILPGERGMLALPQVGRVQQVRELGEDLFEIEAERVIPTGLITLGLCRHALVDLGALKVLRLFTYVPNPISTAGMNCTRTPPWRQP